MISGAINGESALTIRTTQRAADSRYAKIMERHARVRSPAGRQLRRLGDRLGAIYTPVALAVAVLAWVISGRRRALPRGHGHRHALPAPHRYPDRDHRLHFPVRPPCDHRQESRRARADRRVSHRDLRQDRDAHLRRANADRTTDRPGLRPAGSADARGESGALLETSARARHPGVRDEGRDADSGSHRGERTARPGAAWNGGGPSGAGHQPEQADGATHAGRRSTPAARRGTRVRGGD